MNNANRFTDGKDTCPRRWLPSPNRMLTISAYLGFFTSSTITKGPETPPTVLYSARSSIFLVSQENPKRSREQSNPVHLSPSRGSADIFTLCRSDAISSQIAVFRNKGTTWRRLSFLLSLLFFALGATWQVARLGQVASDSPTSSSQLQSKSYSRCKEFHAVYFSCLRSVE